MADILPYTGLFSRRLYFANSQFNSCSRKVISRMDILNRASSTLIIFHDRGLAVLLRNSRNITRYTLYGNCFHFLGWSLLITSLCLGCACAARQGNVCVCVCRLLQLLKNQCSAGKSFATFSWISISVFGLFFLELWLL